MKSIFYYFTFMLSFLPDEKQMKEWVYDAR